MPQQQNKIVAQNVPYNLEAEQAVLGCVLIDNEIIVRVADELTPNDFYDRRHQIICQAMLNLANNDMEIDYTTLISELQVKNMLEEAGGIVYISSLIDATYTTANIDDYISIVGDAALKRNVIAAASSISQAGYDPQYGSTEYIDYAERIISDLAKRRKTGNLIPISEVVEEVNQMMIANRNRNAQLIGLSTGYKKVDEVLLGLQKQKLMILAARPGMGKSAFAMNLAINVARKSLTEEDNKPTVAIFSLEMSQAEITQRMIASMSQVNLNSIQRGSMTQKELSYVQSATQDLKGLNIYYSDVSSLTMADIRAKCRRLKAQFGLDFIVIDYLQLIMSPPKQGVGRQEEVAAISRALKQMARELDVPVLALSQLSRDIEKREDKRPQMSDLRESGSIEQDADVVMFLYRDSVYNKESATPGVAELNIVKNRSGAPSYDGQIKFLFKGEYQTFTTYEGN